MIQKKRKFHSVYKRYIYFNENKLGYEQQSLGSSFGSCNSCRLRSKCEMVQLKRKAPCGMRGLEDSAGSSRTWWGHQRLLAALTSRASADKAVGVKATPRSSFLPKKLQFLFYNLVQLIFGA